MFCCNNTDQMQRYLHRMAAKFDLTEPAIAHPPSDLFTLFTEPKALERALVRKARYQWEIERLEAGYPLY